MKTVKKLVTTLVVAIGLGACSSMAAPPAAAQAVPTIMVAGEDWDPDTFERDNQVFNQVLDALVAEFHAKGFRVYDERALCVRTGCAQDRKRRTDAEIIDIARAMNSPPIDMVLLFQAFPEVKRLPYQTNVKLRIRARLLQVPGGRPAVRPFTDDKSLTAPVDCNSSCIWREAGSHGRELAQDVGNWMSSELANQVYGNQPPPVQSAAGSPVPHSNTAAATAPPSCPAQTSDFVLTFNGFSPSEMATVEKYLVIFTGYCSHRPVPNATGTKVARFNYEAGISEARLQRNLEKVLREVLGGEGTVQSRTTSLGREYVVRKMPPPRVRSVQDGDW